MFTDKLLCTKSGTQEKETTFAPAGVNFFFFEPTSFPIFLISTSPVSHSHVSCSLFFNTSSAGNYPLKYSIILSTDLYLLTMCQALSLYTGVPSFFSIPFIISPYLRFISFQLTGMCKNYLAASRPVSLLQHVMSDVSVLNNSQVTPPFSSACGC